ncbi:hypothetical protein [Photorhabdus asymbiotica]|uniref:hypothetical protein n=1 Tax=Photorhabdus asymbiotica TaxID=291112 RepID=UPI003DA73BC8
MLTQLTKRLSMAGNQPSLTELNHILAYLQLIHFSLPNFSFLGDDIGELDAVVLLHNIYQ